MGRGARTHAAVAGGVAGRCSRPTTVAGSRRDGRPVGWVVGRVFSDGRRWIQQLAVARSALGVQAENENAIGLYRDIGFEVAREWRVYARPTA